MKQNHTNYEIYIYEICFKNRVFIFSKVIVGYKNENWKSNEVKISKKYIYNS